MNIVSTGWKPSNRYSQYLGWNITAPRPMDWAEWLAMMLDATELQRDGALDRVLELAAERDQLKSEIARIDGCVTRAGIDWANSAFTMADRVAQVVDQRDLATIKARDAEEREAKLRDEFRDFVKAMEAVYLETSSEIITVAGELLRRSAFKSAKAALGEM